MHYYILLLNNPNTNHNNNKYSCKQQLQGQELQGQASDQLQKWVIEAILGWFYSKRLKNHKYNL